MEMAKEYPDRITEKFVGKNILITGGTGFMGKVLVEKILRQCPNVGCIYLLIRPKRGNDPQTRIKELLENPLFEKLRSMRSVDILAEKCKVIEGDVSEINLAIKAEDRKLLTEKIDYIYHIAASVRFDEPLKSALLMNTRGTKFMLQLAKECKHLELFCYVSTAYVHPNVKYLQEIPYPPYADPHATIDLIEPLPSDEVDTMTPTLMGDLPNTYTFTKSLSEGLVVEQMDNLPIVIVRPSVVIPMWKEPLPGWGDNINGPMGLMIGAGKGVVRSMYCKANGYADFIPVDIAINAMCFYTWDYLTHKKRRIYNITSSDEIKVTWSEIINTGRKIVTERTPFNNIPWYPGGGLTDSRIVHYIWVFLFQFLPAILVDTILFCLGIKTVLIKVQTKIWKGSKMLEFYTSNQWDFNKSNTYTVKEKLNPLELEIYSMDSTKFDIDEYVNNAVLGARRFILKEPDSTLPAARRHLKLMWFVDRLFKMLVVVGILYYFYEKISLPTVV